MTLNSMGTGESMAKRINKQTKHKAALLKLFTFRAFIMTQSYRVSYKRAKYAFYEKPILVTIQRGHCKKKNIKIKPC